MSKAVGIFSPVQKVSYSGSNKVVVNLPKYKFMTSHTARRTGITLLIEKGTPLPIIMKLTGHSDVKTLLRYDGTTIESLISYIEDL